MSCSSLCTICNQARVPGTCAHLPNHEPLTLMSDDAEAKSAVAAGVTGELAGDWMSAPTKEGLCTSSNSG